MESIPSNNEYSHAPWFHYSPDAKRDEMDPQKAVSFILKYGDKDSKLYQKVLLIDKAISKEKQEPDFSNYSPSEFICWEIMPTDIVESPESPLYTKYKDLVDAELDGIVERLEKVERLPVPGVDNTADWLDIPQIISCYPSTCNFFIII